MSVPFSTVATGVISVSLLHSLVPHHWLPFVAVGRKHGWTTRKSLSVLSLGAFVHTLSTIAVGLLVGFLGQKLDARFETLHGIIPGVILLAFGGGYFYSSFTHAHHHVASEKMAASSLVVMLALSPCVVVAPFFVIMGPMGLALVLKVCLAMSILSVSGMTLFGWLAIKGMQAVKLAWLEENETRVMGALLMLLGVSFIIL